MPATRRPEQPVDPPADQPAGRAAGQSGGTPADPPLGYEQAREELLEVVRTLEEGGTTLEESLELWERGEELARICQAWLDNARERLQAVIGADEEGDPQRP